MIHADGENDDEDEDDDDEEGRDDTAGIDWHYKYLAVVDGVSDAFVDPSGLWWHHHRSLSLIRKRLTKK